MNRYLFEVKRELLQFRNYSQLQKQQYVVSENQLEYGLQIPEEMQQMQSNIVSASQAVHA